ncbi:MAG: carnitine 3-dehydrogenase [Gammaproteobacteria bacterium]
MKVAIIGGGVIGGGWAARLRHNGIPVFVADPDPQAPQKMDTVLAHAAHAMAALTAAPVPPLATVEFVPLATAVVDADWIIESVPERLDLKQQLFAEIEKIAPPGAVITSSTSGLRPSVLQAQMQHPQRLLVAHPFNPVYLLPLVELVGGAQTNATIIARAADFYESLGMHALLIKKEEDAFIADRLLEAVWRESLWLVKDGVATTAEIDDAIRFGFGLRWAQMGLFETYRTAGGDGGMRHFLRQFGPCLKWPWTKLMDTPELDESLIEKIAAQSDAQSGGYSIGELERFRDDNLIAILHGLRANHWGAGKTLAKWEAKLWQTKSNSAPAAKPLQMFVRHAPKHWMDYNGHMNESRYLECFSDATDAFMRQIGADEQYVADGFSYFTVETHIRHLQEVCVGDKIIAETQVLPSTGKKLRLFHWLKNSSGEIYATGEHLLIHVNLQTRRACEPLPAVANTAANFAAAHSSLPKPEGALA